VRTRAAAESLHAYKIDIDLGSVMAGDNANKITRFDRHWLGKPIDDIRPMGVVAVGNRPIPVLRVFIEFKLDPLRDPKTNSRPLMGNSRCMRSNRAWSCHSTAFLMRSCRKMSNCYEVARIH
jgi:hypothetical protein